jgi:hypothetical protein
MFWNTNKSIYRRQRGNVFCSKEKEMSEVPVVNGSITLFQVTCPICGVTSPMFTLKTETEDWFVQHSNTHTPKITEILIGSVPSVAADGSITLSVSTQIV